MLFFSFIDDVVGIINKFCVYQCKLFGYFPLTHPGKKNIDKLCFIFDASVLWHCLHYVNLKNILILVNDVKMFNKELISSWGKLFRVDPYTCFRVRLYCCCFICCKLAVYFTNVEHIIYICCYVFVLENS